MKATWLCSLAITSIAVLVTGCAGAEDQPRSASTPAVTSGESAADDDEAQPQPAAPLERIAFTVWEEPGVGHPMLWTGNSDGTDLRQVGDQNAEFPDWSPDRTHLIITYFDAEDDIRIARINADGSGFRSLTDDELSEAPDYSPDGSRIAFNRGPVSDENDPAFTTELWIMDADGSNQRRLLNPSDAGFDYEPEYSPDGSKIVFVRYNTETDTSAVFIVDADGADVVQLSPWATYVEHPRWSPDGTTIIYNIEYQPDFDDPRNGIWIVPAAGGDPAILLATTPTVAVFKPDFSPQGDRIVFGCYWREEGNEDICVMNSDGTGIVRITDTSTYENHPVWD